jgi:hypothetical protein
MAGGIEKRLQALADKIGSRRARHIVILVDGEKEDQSAADALVQTLDVKRNDLVVYLARFTGDRSDLPKVVSVDPL